jgi:hypothetical protein
MAGILYQYTAAYAGGPPVGTDAANMPMATMMAAANQFVTMVTGFVMNAVPIPGTGNPGYQGGGEFDIGFKYVVQQIENDLWNELTGLMVESLQSSGDVDSILGKINSDTDVHTDLESWLKNGGMPNPSSPSPPSQACFASYAAYMNKWGKILAAWYKTTHQPPPPGIVPPPPPCN